MRPRNYNAEPPRDNTYSEWLRYLVQSSDPDAGELPFFVGMWSCCLFNKGLSAEQQTSLQPYIDEATLFLEVCVYEPAMRQKNYDLTNVVSLNDFAGDKDNGH